MQSNLSQLTGVYPRFAGDGGVNRRPVRQIVCCGRGRAPCQLVQTLSEGGVHVTLRQTFLLVIVLAILLGFSLGEVVSNWPW
jgi:hypothetical protein